MLSFPFRTPPLSVPFSQARASRRLSPRLVPCSGRSLSFSPDPIQSAILDSPDPALLLLCTRQFGKTTLTAIKALHFALTHPDTLTVVAAPTARRSGEWIRLVHGFLAHLGLPVRGDRIHPFSAVLPNRSRLIGLPGAVNTNRGYPAHLLIVDEAAFVPDPGLPGPHSLPRRHQRRPVAHLLRRPRVRLLPHQWRESQIPWRRFQVTAAQCPRISPEFLARERLILGESAFQQEFFCQFQPGARFPITRDLLDAAIDASYRPITSLWESVCTP